ncbi:MAG: YIP1 family protein [Candidatus Bathyarchaeia archaeon]
MNPIEHNLVIAFKILRNPAKALDDIKSENTFYAISYLLMIGAITAFLTPLQICLGFEDINGLHAGGQAEYLAREVSSLYDLNIIWRPLLVETFYLLILLITTGYLYIILKVVGGKGSMRDTLKMIAYGDTPGLLFGWIPYFATISAVWSAVIQILIGSIVIHRIPWTRSTILFSILIGLGIIDIALSSNI